MVITDDVKRHLLNILRILREKFGLSSKNSLMTDRTFLVKALKIIKANAALNARGT